MNRSSELLATTKKLFALAVPMAGSQFINVASGFLCMAMLARLGPEILAASALIFTTQLSIMVTGMSVLFSISVLIGYAYGAKEYAVIGRFVQQGWLLGLIMSIPIMILFWNIDTVLIKFGQTAEIANTVKDYFHAFFWAVIPGFISTCAMQFGYGIHKKGLMLTISVCSVFVLLLSAYALIFGEWGMPKLGVAGLGYATAIQYTFFLVVALLIFYFDKDFHPYQLFRRHKEKGWSQLQKILKIGGPISVQMGGEMLSFFVSGLLIGWLGSTALSAFQVVNQYYFLIVVPIFALSQASSILIGQARGAKQFHTIKILGQASIVSAIAACAIVASLFIFLPTHLAAFYLDVGNPDNADILKLCIAIFMIIAFSQALDGLRNVYIGILRGLFDTRFSMQMSILSIWIIGMPLSYLLAFPLHYGAIGFVIGGAIGMLSGVVLMSYRWYNKMSMVS